MKHRFTLLLMVLGLHFCSLRGQVLGWAARMGSTDYDAGQAITADADGNIYHTGYFQGTVDFDPGVGSLPFTCVSDEDIYVAKWGYDGHLIWVRTIGSLGMDYSQDIALDADGNVLVAGTFSGTTDFDPGPATFIMDCEGATDGFLLKLDNDGNFIWAIQIEGPAAQYVQAVGVDANGDYYLAGSFLGSTDFDPSSGSHLLTPWMYENAYVAKFSDEGNLTWVKSFGGTGSAQARDLSVSEAGSLVLGGMFSDAMDADPGSDSLILNANSMDAFLIGLHPDGELAWAGAFGGEDWDLVEALGMDANGNVYAGGFIQDTSDFDLGMGVSWLQHAGGRAGFLASYDSAGILRWAHLTGASEINGVAVDTHIGVTIAGSFGDTIDCNPGLGGYIISSQGLSDILYSLFSTDGDFQGASACGGTSTDMCHDLVMDAGGSIFATGYFWGDCDFDPTGSALLLSSAGVRDIFVQRVDAPVGVEDAARDLWVRAFPNPATDQVTVSCSSPVIEVVAVSLLGVEMARWEGGEFSMKGLPGGLYLLKVLTTDGEVFLRLRVL